MSKIHSLSRAQPMPSERRLAADIAAFLGQPIPPAALYRDLFATLSGVAERESAPAADVIPFKTRSHT